MAGLQGKEVGEAKLVLFTSDESDIRGREVGRAGRVLM